MSSTRSIAPAGRAVFRWAWRLFRREWRSQALVLALTTVVVAAAVVGAAMSTESLVDPSGVFGRAGAMVRLSGDDATMDRSIDAARQRFGDIEVIGESHVDVPGSLETIRLLAADPHGALGAPMIGLRDGRYPTGATEVALTSGAADLLGVELGSTVDVGRTARTVVGIVENPLQLDQRFALVDPTGAPAPERVIILVRDPNVEGSGQIDSPLQVRPDNGPSRILLVVIVITVAMTLVGLVAAAGFVVIAQRRQRQLGLLAAIGATRRHLGWVMVATGALVGLTAALAGTVLGVAAWQVVRPTVADTAGRRLGWLELPWPMILLAGALAVLSSTAAAWWPARSAARVPVMTALSGRPPLPRPVHRPIVAAIVLAGGGVAAITASGATQPEPNQLLLIGGMLAVILGMVVAAPATVRAAGIPAGRLPLPGRIALRDLSRYRARAAASLAAIALALGITVGIVVLATAAGAHRGPANLPSNELMLQLGVGGDRDQPVPTAADVDSAALDARAATVVAALGVPASTLALDVAVNPSGGSAGRPVAAGRRADEHSLEVMGPLFVATPEVLARYGIDAASIDPATDLLTSDAEVNVALDESTRTGDAPWPTQVLSSLPDHSSEPRSLITEAALARHGWQAVPAGWLLRTERPLTHDQLTAARAAAARAGLVAETRSTEGAVTDLQTWATRIGVVLAMLIVVMSVGLVRADAAPDLRTLTANGAPARTRRAIAAATAATLAVLGALLATTAAYAIMIAALHHDLSRLVPVPWRSLVQVLVGLPVLAAVVAWCASGREPRVIARRALD